MSVKKCAMSRINENFQSRNMVPSLPEGSGRPRATSELSAHTPKHMGGGQKKLQHYNTILSFEAMRSFLTLTGVLVILQSCSLLTAKEQSPVPLKPAQLNGPLGASKIFPFRKYEDFQISDGVAGHSLERANEVFVKPFEGINFAEITQLDLNNLAAMANVSIFNEKLFVEAIKKSGGTSKHPNAPLAAGLIANKVLKLVGYRRSGYRVQQVSKITTRKLIYSPRPFPPTNLAVDRLGKNVKLDKQRAGQKMVSYLSLGKKSGGSKAAGASTETGGNAGSAGTGGNEGRGQTGGAGSNTGGKGAVKQTSVDGNEDDD
ncbi:hypothetical protein VP01_36g6 [Puccinia sorghi]|uniref:Uncharacterized protein n=1 Tax=Puccinia sorghi TaxID=27349 RepID=A0A0L6UUZ1_9BASI|nr:hypothetical protein VP01_36g6 [Puccinia sorghi]